MIEKILSELQVLKEDAVDKWDGGASHRAYTKAIEIVQEVAKEYGKDTNVPSNGWIPAEKELPSESGEYYTYVYYDGHYMYSIDEIDCDGMIKKWNCSSDYQILGWKPIAPYQKGE